jgi:hypothetical protein
VIGEPAQDPVDRADLVELVEDEPDDLADPLVRVQHDLAGGPTHIAQRQRELQLPAPCLVEPAREHPLLDPVQFRRAHRPLQPEQQPVVVVGRIVDSIGIRQQDTPQRAQFQQLTPVPLRAGQTRHLDAQQETDVIERYLGDQTLEPRAVDSIGARASEVLIDHQHARPGPAQGDRPLYQRVL